jgi:hypothetical protein
MFSITIGSFPEEWASRKNMLAARVESSSGDLTSSASCKLTELSRRRSQHLLGIRAKEVGICLSSIRGTSSIFLRVITHANHCIAHCKRIMDGWRITVTQTPHIISKCETCTLAPPRSVDGWGSGVMTCFFECSCGARLA